MSPLETNLSVSGLCSSFLTWNEIFLLPTFVFYALPEFQNLCFLTLKMGFLPGKSSFLVRNSRWLLSNVASESQLSPTSEILLTEILLLQNSSEGTLISFYVPSLLVHWVNFWLKFLLFAPFGLNYNLDFIHKTFFIYLIFPFLIHFWVCLENFANNKICIWSLIHEIVCGAYVHKNSMDQLK